MALACNFRNEHWYARYGDEISTSNSSLRRDLLLILRIHWIHRRFRGERVARLRLKHPSGASMHAKTSVSVADRPRQRLKSGKEGRQHAFSLHQ
jgi:hypothetical protein